MTELRTSVSHLQPIWPPIFNSLGSNYSSEFAWFMLKSMCKSNKKNCAVARKYLKEQLGSNLELTYKGRDALWLLLKRWGFGPGDLVLTQAFGCFAIEWAITQVGATPIFVDVAERQVNMSLPTLEHAWQTHVQQHKRRPQQKLAVILQHSLGHRVSTPQFKKWCTKHQALLIEDLAQGYSTEQLQHSWCSVADGVLYSFGQDKVIDIGVGGAYLDQTKLQATTPPPSRTQTQAIPILEQGRAALYPSLSVYLRRWYGTIWHQFLFRLSKSVGLLRSPVKNLGTAPGRLPDWLLLPLLKQMQRLEGNLLHRKRIAEIYDHTLKPWAIAPVVTTKQMSHLRYTLWVSDPQSLIAYLRDYQVLISDRWYRQPSDSGSLGYHSQYVLGSCPATEDLCHHCVNLPTHQNVSANQAYKIAQLAKSWLMVHDAKRRYDTH